MNVKNIREGDEKAIAEWLEKNPDYEIAENVKTRTGSKANGIISSQGQGNYVGKATAKDGGWKEVLDGIKEKHPYAKFRD